MVCFVIEKLVRAIYELVHELRIIRGCTNTGAPVFRWSVGPVTNKERKSFMEIKLTDEQKVLVTLAAVTPKGKPVKVDGVPTWEVQSGDSQVQPTPDGLSATIVSADAPGITVINVTADADLDEGVRNITEVLNVTVVDPQASSLGISVGAPEDK